MLRSKCIPTHYLVLLIGVIFLFVGCQSQLTSTENSPTIFPSNTPYTSFLGGNIQLKFDYPSDWVRSEENPNEQIWVLGLSDPRVRARTTLSPGESHLDPTDFGSVVIWLFPLESANSADKEADRLKDEEGQTNRIKFLNDYQIQIDGYDARVLEYEIDDPESFTSLMFVRSTLFIVGDRSYKIVFTIAKKDRHGEFEQGYEHLISSLKVLH